MGRTLKVNTDYITRYSNQSVVDGQLTSSGRTFPRYGTVVVNGRLPDSSACKGNVTIDGIQVGNTGNSFQTLAKRPLVSSAKRVLDRLASWSRRSEKFVSVKVSP